MGERICVYCGLPAPPDEFDEQAKEVCCALVANLSQANGGEGLELPDEPGVRWHRRDGDWVIATAITGDGFAGLCGIRAVHGRVGIDLPRGGWHKADAALMAECERLKRNEEAHYELLSIYETQLGITPAGDTGTISSRIDDMQSELATLKATLAELKPKSDSFDEIWKVCVELGMKVHPPGDDEDGVYQPEEYAYQFGFIRSLAESNTIFQERIATATTEIERLTQSRSDIVAAAAFALWGQPAHKTQAAEADFKRLMVEAGLDWNGDTQPEASGE